MQAKVAPRANYRDGLVRRCCEARGSLGPRREIARAATTLLNTNPLRVTRSLAGAYCARDQRVVLEGGCVRKPTLFAVIVFAITAWMTPLTAEAASVTCPDPPRPGQTNSYTVDPAIDCVWGNSNIGQGNPLQDEFLQGGGTNDATYGDSGPTFGKAWTMVGSNGNAGDPITGITFSGMTATFANFVVTNSSYAFYALGVVDGGGPRWSVFLLDGKSGTVSMTGGNFGHFAVYGSNTGAQELTVDPVPEPTSMLLLGTGLAVAGQRLRRRRASRTTPTAF